MFLITLSLLYSVWKKQKDSETKYYRFSYPLFSENGYSSIQIQRV